MTPFSLGLDHIGAGGHAKEVADFYLLSTFVSDGASCQCLLQYLNALGRNRGLSM